MGCGASKKKQEPQQKQEEPAAAATITEGETPREASAPPPKASTKAHGGDAAAPLTPRKQGTLVNELSTLPSADELKKPREERDSSKKIFEGIDALLKTTVDASSFAQLTSHVLNGDLDQVVAPQKRVVRLFTSSTFTDTKFERDHLMNDVYPFINEVCRRLGFEFQVIDMRWGVRESTTDDHSTTALCLSEIDACRTQSAGPAFFAMLCDKTGYRPFPARIEREELDAMKKWLSENGESPPDPTVALLNEWYELDENAVPDEYRLKPKSKENVGDRDWWGDIFEPLQIALRKAAAGINLEPEKALQYSMAVTENENHRGVLDNPHAAEQCIVFRRKSTGLAERVKSLEGTYPKTAEAFVNALDVVKDKLSEGSQSKLASVDRGNLASANRTLMSIAAEVIGTKDTFPDDVATPASDLHEMNIARNYIDCLWDKDGGIKLDAEAVELLRALKEEKIARAKLDDRSLRNYEIEWNPSGLDPDGIPAHKEHVMRVAEEFVTVMVDSVKAGWVRERRPDDEDFEESAEHISFLHRKVKSFVGREDVLAEVAKYTQAPFQNKPFVVTGYSGSGKTSVLAKAASLVKEKNPKAVLIMRFLGTTPNSTSANLLMKSCARQAHRAYEDEVAAKEVPSVYSEVIPVFADMLNKASAERPLYIFLDSLDQILTDPSRGNDPSWIPLELPDHVYLVMSAIPEVKGYTQYLAKKLDSACFYQVPKLPMSDGEQVLGSMLANLNPPRTLTPVQRELVLKQFEVCPSPLFLDLAVNLSRRWLSSDTLDECSLDSTVREAINDILNRLERKHGKLLVSHGLGLITASLHGMSLTELQDILACDEEVLNDVFQWWVPPQRRLPPSLWVRVRADLGNYLIERGADGQTVYAWYHRQFWEAAGERYLGTDSERKARHREIADYFQSKWAGVEKPYTDKAGKQLSADRGVIPQPIFFHGKENNYRKTAELPYHLEKLEAWDELYDLVTDLDLYDEDSNVEGDNLRRLWVKCEKFTGNKIEEGFLQADADEDNIDSLEMIAGLLQDYDRHDAAFQINEKIIKLVKETKGETSQEYGRYAGKFAALLSELEGEGEATEEYFRIALDILAQGDKGKDSLEYVECEGDYADWISTHGEEGLQKAIAIRERQLQIESEELGEEDSQTNATRGNLGILYMDAKNFEAAEKCLQRGLEIEIMEYGPTHSEVGGSYINFCVLYEKWGRPDRADAAQKCAIQACKIAEGIYGKEHTQYKDALKRVRDVHRVFEGAAPIEGFGELVTEMQERQEELDAGDDDDEDGDDDDHDDDDDEDGEGDDDEGNADDDEE